MVSWLNVCSNKRHVRVRGCLGAVDAAYQTALRLGWRADRGACAIRHASSRAAVWLIARLASVRISAAGGQRLHTEAATEEISKALRMVRGLTKVMLSLT
jgi:hypothetical protein